MVESMTSESQLILEYPVEDSFLQMKILESSVIQSEKIESETKVHF